VLAFDDSRRVMCFACAFAQRHAVRALSHFVRCSVHCLLFFFAKKMCLTNSCHFSL
jgi:hypothetical protein